MTDQSSLQAEFILLSSFGGYVAEHLTTNRIKFERQIGIRYGRKQQSISRSHINKADDLLHAPALAYPHFWCLLCKKNLQCFSGRFALGRHGVLHVIGRHGHYRLYILHYCLALHRVSIASLPFHCCLRLDSLIF